MKIKHLLFISAAAVFLSTTVQAGGYQLNDYSVTGLGRSFAGAGVVGDDFSALAYNPAGMTLKRSGMQGGFTVVQMKADVKNAGTPNPGTTPGTIRLYQPLPHMFAQYRPNEDWTFGLGIYTPFGLSTKYKRSWFGRNQAVESRLDIIDIAPAVAYKINDQWSVGATVIARYIYGKMTSTINDIGFNKFELDGWTKTGIVGVMFEPVKDTRFGLSYKLRSKQKVKGDHTITRFPDALGLNGTFAGSASPDLPDSILLSAYHRLNKSFAVTGSARWTHWSVFEDFVMKSDAPLLAPANGEYHSRYQWKNSWTLTGGLEYYHNKHWTFRMGTGYDESPSHDVTTRTARIPDNDRIWASCGFSYKQGRWTTDVGYAHMFMKTTKVKHTDQSGNEVDAKYDSQSNMLGLQVQYDF